MGKQRKKKWIEFLPLPKYPSSLSALTPNPPLQIFQAESSVVPWITGITLGYFDISISCGLMKDKER